MHNISSGRQHGCSLVRQDEQVQSQHRLPGVMANSMVAASRYPQATSRGSSPLTGAQESIKGLEKKPQQ